MILRIRPKDKLTLISNMGTMLKAGIPILEAIDTLKEDSKGDARKLLELMHDTLNEGQPLSHAFERVPMVFDAVTVNLVRSAEEAGRLEEGLHDLTVSIQKDMEFSDKIRASLMYPMFVMVIFLAVLILILTFVIPRVAKVFAGLKVALPPATVFMIAASNFVLTYYLYIIAVIIVLIVGLVLFFRYKKTVAKNLFLSLPLLDKLGRMIDLTRFTRSMSLLLRTGVPVAEALGLSRHVVVRSEMLKAIEAMDQAVASGKPMSEGLKGSRAVPTIMRHILQTAEISGSLESTMQELAEYFDIQVSRTLKAVTALIEPVMIVLIGLLVGGMMLAIIAPIYNIISQIQG